MKDYSSYYFENKDTEDNLDSKNKLVNLRQKNSKNVRLAENVRNS